MLEEGFHSTCPLNHRQLLPAEKINNQFNCSGGEQINVQGKNGIGKQVNNNGIPPEFLTKYAEEFGVTKSALTSFFTILEQEPVPLWELDSKMRELACQYKEFKLRLQVISSDDPEVKALKKQAEQAFENGRFSEVEELLNQIDGRCDNAILQLHKIQAETAEALEKQQLCKAENLVSKAKLQDMQYRYTKAAEYWQEAAAALPEGHEWKRATYLGMAGYDLYHVPRYSEALEYSNQSLMLFRVINDSKEEAKLLNNISLIYQAQGAYEQALDSLEKCLSIWQEIGNKQGQGATLNNIAAIHYSKGEYDKALGYLEQSLHLRRETGDREGESTTLNNIGQIYDAQRNYAVALQHYDRALVISRKLKDKRMESACLNNISTVYKTQGELDVALKYAEHALVIVCQINDRRTEGITLNNLATLYEAHGDRKKALTFYEQSLARAKEIGNKDCEAATSSNIGRLCQQQGELIKAEPYISRAAELMEQLEHPKLEECREILEEVRTKLREQRN